MLNKQIGCLRISTRVLDIKSIQNFSVLNVTGLHVYFNSDPALTPLQTRPFQLAQMKFSRGTRLPYRGGALTPLATPNPEGAPRLSSA